MLTHVNHIAPANNVTFARCVRTLFILWMELTFFNVYAQPTDLKDFPAKGSYLYYDQPAFEDNSFLLEEAFNQPMGVIQHVSSFSWNNVKQGNFSFNFTQEIPITDLKHQFSYSLNYSLMEPADGSKAKNGFGDMYISYRPSLMDENQWMMLAPRITLILPTGNSSQGLGQGGWGGQLNVAITKRLSRQLITHYNFGTTFIHNADYYQDTPAEPVLTYQRNLYHKNAGIGFIWIAQRKCHVMLEYLSDFTQNIKHNGGIITQHQGTISPGLRYCIDTGKMQIVPGIAAPLRVTNHAVDIGVFLYLSIEPDYLAFYKPKGR